MTLSRLALTDLRRAVGPDHVIHNPHDLALYERDASIAGALPDVVVLPATTGEVAAVVRAARDHGLPVVARGAGTGLSGGAVAIQGGIVLSLSRMRRILDLDPLQRTALVEPGVVNADLSLAAARHGLFYAPDPSSQRACTIGGNAAENSGGPHCLYYGVTSNHVLGLEVVLADGSVRWVESAAPDRPGLDLVGVLIGSEGTLAVITKVLVRLLRMAESTTTLMAAFPTIEAASAAVSAVIAQGILPTALEMMDTVTIGAVEAHYQAGYPTDAGAVLLAEVEGLAETTAELSAEIERILVASEASSLRRAESAAERERLWAGRKGAIGALGRIKPNYYLHDGVVPRTRLPEMLAQVGEIGRFYGLPVANVFHAGDGNLHPNILFDLRDPGILHIVEHAAEEMLRACVEAGGTLSGEHGIGLEKNAFMPWIFGPADIEAMLQVKHAFDPDGRLNPGKIFPPPAVSRLHPPGRGRTGLAAEATWW